jgi:uncharacterized membrane protein
MRIGQLPQVGVFSVTMIFIISLLSITLIPGSILAQEDNGSTQSSLSTRQVNEVNLYFHNGEVLNTIPGNNTALPTTTSLNDQEQVTFTIQPSIKGNLEVDGDSIGTSQFGFRIYLRIRNPNLPAQNAMVTFTIYDDSSLIAKNANPFVIPGQQDTRNQFPLEVPFTSSSKSKHTFSANSVFTVDINVSLEGPTPILITYDRGENDGYIKFNCIQVKNQKVNPFHADNTASEKFYPNLPDADQRVMVFKGQVEDSFGAYDISEVTIGVENIITTPQEATYVFNDEDAIGYFELVYDYDAGLSPGPYLITAYITDYSDNTYLATSTLTIASYGVYLECFNNSGYGYPSETVQFTISVYNIGGNSDSVTLSATYSCTGWITEFDGGDTTNLIQPGTSVPKKLKVTISANAQKIDECLIYIRGNSLNDNKESDSLDSPISVGVKSQFTFSFDITSDLTQTIDKGDSATFTFKLGNTGSEDDRYTVKVNTGPLSGTDWTAILSTTASGTTKVSDYEYMLSLQQTKVADFTLTVTAPQTTTTELIELTVSATSENITETSQKTKSHETTTKLKGVAPPGKITLEAKTQTKIAAPGDTIDAGIVMSLAFEITAENEDENNDYYVLLSVKQMPITWTYSITSSDFSLAASDSKDFSIVLDILETEYAGSYSFDLEAGYTPEDSSGETQTTSITLAVTIPEVIDAELTPEDESEGVTYVDQEISYIFIVTYKGNVKDIDFELDFNEISGWEISLTKNEINFKNYDESENIELTMKPTDSADLDEKGIVEISLKDKDSGKDIGTKLTFKTTVNKDTNKEVANFFKDYWPIPILVVAIFFLTYVVRKRL